MTKRQPPYLGYGIMRSSIGVMLLVTMTVLGAAAVVRTANHIRERRESDRFRKEIAFLDSTMRTPRDWPVYRSEELALATAFLRTRCYSPAAGVPGVSWRLFYQLRVAPASPALLEPIRRAEAKENDRPRRRPASPAELFDEAVSGEGLNRDESAFMRMRQRSLERIQEVQGADTVFTVTFFDSLGFRRGGFAVFGRALESRILTRDSTLTASDSTLVRCTPEMRQWSSWRLSRVVRPPI